MRTVLISLVVSALLGHALIEWSWHGSHGCSDCGPDVASSLIRPTCCDQRLPAGPSQGQPCECQLTGEGGCKYLPPQKTPRDALQLLSPLDAVAVALPSCHDSLPGGLWQRGGGRGDPEPPLRLHLLHQILLI